MKGKYNIAGTYKEYRQRLSENLFSKNGEEVAEEIADDIEQEIEEEEDEDAEVADRAEEDAEVEAEGEGEERHAPQGGGYGTPGINAPDRTPMPPMFGGMGAGTPPEMGATGAIPAIQHAISVAFSIAGESDGLAALTSFERPEWVVTRVMTDRGERIAMEKQAETDAEILVGNLSYEAALQASTDMSQKLEIPEYDNATDKYIGKVSSKVVRKEKPLGGSYKYN